MFPTFLLLYRFAKSGAMYCLDIDENRSGSKITVVRPSHPREVRSLSFTNPRDAMVVDGKVCRIERNKKILSKHCLKPPFVWLIFLLPPPPIGLLQQPPQRSHCR
jgi:hypothetical protein